VKKIAILIIICVFSISAFADGLDSIPALKGRITDVTSTLSVKELANIEQILVVLDSYTTCELVVLIIPTTGSETIEEYSMRAAEKWKIGKKEKDNGVILLIAKNDRKVRIEVGYGLEGILTDASSIRIIDNYIVPEFKNGDFYGGIYSGVGQISGILKGEINYVDYAKINVEYEQEEPNSLMYRYPTLGISLMFIGFIIPILPGFFMKKKLKTVIITSIIPIIFVLLVGLFWESLAVTITLLFFPLIMSIFVVITRITSKGKKGFFSVGSSNYSSSSGSYRSSSNSYSSGSSYSSSSSSYSGGGGSFGGGGASGRW